MVPSQIPGSEELLVEYLYQIFIIARKNIFATVTENLYYYSCISMYMAKGGDP